MADQEKNETMPAEEHSAAVEKTAKEKKPKAKNKPSVGTRIKNFFKSYKSEFKKIVWASPKSVLNNTVVVVVSVVISGAAIALLDYVFSTAIVTLTELI